MIRKIVNIHLVCTLVFTLMVNCLHAQQTNKPQTTPAVTPTVKQTPGPYGSNVKVNYVRTWLPNGPVTDPNTIPTADYTEVLQTTQYIDGLGRPLQTVNRRSTPAKTDLVSPVGCNICLAS